MIQHFERSKFAGEKVQVKTARNAHKRGAAASGKTLQDTKSVVAMATVLDCGFELVHYHPYPQMCKPLQQQTCVPVHFPDKVAPIWPAIKTVFT